MWVWFYGKFFFGVVGMMLLFGIGGSVGIVRLCDCFVWFSFIVLVLMLVSIV